MPENVNRQLQLEIGYLYNSQDISGYLKPDIIIPVRKSPDALLIMDEAVSWIFGQEGANSLTVFLTD